MSKVLFALGVALVLGVSHVRAEDVRGTKVHGVSTQEPPSPNRDGNPFPKDPKPPLNNSLRDSHRDMNPQKDPDVERAIKQNYQRHQDNQKKK